jgi:Cdc6-like AAA superfamily ATPase
LTHIDFSPVDEISKSSHQIDLKVRECFEGFESTRKHLNEMNSYSKVNQEGQAMFRALRTVPYLEERAPLTIKLSQERNERFFGRQEELAEINAKLGAEEIGTVQSFTIYGRRGVGKTQLALEYAHSNAGKFDAVFWIKCETSASLRQSIANAAKDLNLLGAKQSGHHEGNLAGVHDWLKTTRCRWLLVFDNAESERLLKGYWPLGARGSILITSRKHYNFLKDIDRDGMTVKPFNEEQSLDLLLKLLGEAWEAKWLVEPFRLSDLEAGKALMKKIGGLALAIEQAAKLITNQKKSIRGFLDLFMEKLLNLPARSLGERDELVRSLDTIWSISFDSLSSNARALLGALAFLAPDGIQEDLFLPRDQTALRGKLEFCMTSPSAQEGARTALSSVAAPSPILRDVIEELLKAKLIDVDNRTFTVHRVIQEAMNYQNFADLQESFDAAVRVVYEAFPKQQNTSVGPLHEVWSQCQEYVQHVVHLFARFSEYQPSNMHSVRPLNALKELILLGANCGW